MGNDPGYYPRVPIFADLSGSAVCAVSGYGIVVSVRDGDLVVADGIDTERRERAYARAGRAMRRLVILGTGTVSTAALSWCADVGATVYVLDRRGRMVLSSARGTDDARLRRSQARAYGTPLGYAIAQELVGECVRARSGVAASHLGDAELGRLLSRVALPGGNDLDKLREAEAAAAIPYFAAWKTVSIRFARREKVPEHWRSYSGRRSPLANGSPRNSVGPINAILNYLYALGEVECRNALVRIGLDAGMGFLHADSRDRDSLALDLLEVVRPHVEGYVLRLLTERVFVRKDFSETLDGRCRIGDFLAQSLSATLPEWAGIAAPWAERIAHALADASTYDIRKRNVLTREKCASPSRRKPLWVHIRCEECGRLVDKPRRKTCSECWAVKRTELMAERVGNARKQLTAMRAAGNDPAQSPEARSARSESLRRNRAARIAWEQAHPGPLPDPVEFKPIWARLAGVPLDRMCAVTGISVSAASQIRSGSLVPHPCHWDALSSLSN